MKAPESVEWTDVLSGQKVVAVALSDDRTISAYALFEAVAEDIAAGLDYGETLGWRWSTPPK